MTGPTITLTFNVSIAQEDLDAMRLGWYPQDMDDRWVGIASKDAVDLYRSWTRQQIYKIPYNLRDGVVWLGPLFVVDNPDFYNRSSGVDDVAVAKSLLKRYIEACLKQKEEGQL